MKFTNYILKLLLLLIALIIFSGCRSEIDKDDSLQIINKFNCYLNSEHQLFVNFGKDRDKVLSIDVEYIFYSPDSTKMFAITYLEYRSKSKGCKFTNDSSTFFFYPFVGYRQDIKSKWEIFFYESQLLLDGCSTKTLNSYIENNFIDNFNSRTVFYYSKNEIIEKKVGFNIDENGFWNSPFWQKGGLIKDKYPFEVDISDFYDFTFELVDTPDCDE